MSLIRGARAASLLVWAASRNGLLGAWMFALTTLHSPRSASRHSSKTQKNQPRV